MAAEYPRGCVVAVLMGAAACFSGCATPVTFKTNAAFATEVQAKTPVALAPLDMELHELKAGGTMEKQDEWTASSRTLVTNALLAEYALKDLSATKLEPASETQKELREVQGLLDRFTTSRNFEFLFPLPDTATKPFTLEVGELKQLSQVYGTDPILFVYIRDSYSTAGRKALGALGLVAGAMVGVVIVPGQAPTACSAMLVNRQGKLLWFNSIGSVGDLRTPEGAKALATALLNGLPNKTH